MLKTPTISSIKKSVGQLKISWGKIKNATKYQIYRSTEKNGVYRKVGAVKAGTLYFVDKKVTKKTKYFYKIRAFATGLGGKSYSIYSTVKGKKAK